MALWFPSIGERCVKGTDMYLHQWRSEMIARRQEYVASAAFLACLGGLGMVVRTRYHFLGQWNMQQYTLLWFGIVCCVCDCEVVALNLTLLL